MPTPSRRLLLRWAAWFCFANTGLFLLLALRYLRVMSWPEEGAARLFLVLACLGHFSVVAMAPWLLLAPAILAWPRKWVAFPLSVLLATLLLLLLVVDATVFTLYRFHLNGMVWSLMVNGGMFEILPLSGNTWLVVGLIIVLGLLAEAGLAWGAWKGVQRWRGHGKWVALGVALIVVAGNLMHIWADAVNRTSVTRLVRLLPAYQPLTAKRRLRKLGFSIDQQAPGLQTPAEGTALCYPLEPLNCAPPTPLLNVLLLVIDGWRFDMLNEAVTPRLWQLAERAVRFERHSAAANSTRFGIFTLFYGLPGTYWHAILAEQRGPVLVSRLKQAGYDFAVFASARLTSPEFDRTVFADVRDRIPLMIPGDTTPDRDAEITRRFLQFLDRRNPAQPFLGFLFYDSTHGYTYPSNAPAPFRPVCAQVDHLKLSHETDPLPIRNRFLNAAHFVDSLAGQVLDRLTESGLMESTVVIVTADHGQEFNETGRNYWGHNSNFSRYQTQVPFLLHWPGRSPGVVTNLTTHLDVAPTLLREMLGCTTPPERFSVGRSLFDPEPRVPLLLASWEQFALLSPGRIDVMYKAGFSDNYDEDYRELHTPAPAKIAAAAMEQMSRFYAR